MVPFKSMIIGATLALSTSVAMAAQVGVVGLYQNGTTLNEATVAALGCSVEREGIVVTAQGGLSPRLPQPDRFIVLACDQSVLTASVQRTSVAALFPDGEAIAVFEGALTKFQEADEASNVAQRQYILKLGYFNNTDIDGREADLIALDTQASSLEGHWTTAAYLKVHSAMGIATPDEVVLLYYDSAEIAESFRASNYELLEVVGAFNDAHLTAFTYFVGVATR